MNRLSECQYRFVLVDLLCHSPSDQLTTELAAKRRPAGVEGELAEQNLSLRVGPLSS